MNARERFLSVMNFEPCDRTMLWEFGYWGGTLRQWYNEGLQWRTGIREDVIYGTPVSGEAMPAADRFDPQLKSLFPSKDTRDRDVSERLGFDQGFVMLPVNTSLCPAFTPGVVEERAETRIEVDGFGVTREVRNLADSIPHFISWPVETIEDFEKLKERLQPGVSARVPVNWNDLIAKYRDCDFPLVLGYCGEGFFGNLRRLMGEVKLLTAYYDDPDLIRQMNDYFADLWISIWDEVLSVIRPDAMWFWEDMCFKNGPLISPELFREFMLPYYQKVTRFLGDHGVKVRIVDTDGDCWKLIPLFIESGITGLSPFEVAAGMDIVEVRKAFPRLQILGGIDKQAIARGPDAIDEELDYKLPFMLEQGGYIPHADHIVHPDVSWENFKYYRSELRDYVARCGN
ncbi:MAG: hypothetical protein HYX78_15740 [Armatimonadetes bacterium]|nr:hypothetical protein [Armatimonadota bacterium]